MKKYFLLLTGLALYVTMYAAQTDMQAHVASDDGKAAYTAYLDKQAAYYTGSYAYSLLAEQNAATLFGSLNELMGNTCRLEKGGFSYNSLRDAYVNVDRDLNFTGNIIGYYDGYSFSGKWDSGKTWNREHTWPQSMGADKGISMGHDMQSVRPTRTAVNSDRGNTPYGEGASFYDPDEIKINNSYCQKKNNATYRGDAARVILYDYIVYGQNGGYKNDLYNSNAQLLSKMGKSGVFESVAILLKWHMQDPPSLTEMVRNDGAQEYQGNRNPFIDFPELAIAILKNEVTTYTVSVCEEVSMTPNYAYSTKEGFVAYITYSDGTHPEAVEVSGAQATYDKAMGRLTLTNVTANVSVSAEANPNPQPFSAVEQVWNNSEPYVIYDIMGRQTEEMSRGNLYILRQGNVTRKVLCE